MSFSGFVPDKSVRDSAELQRIADLPRRKWDEQTAKHLGDLFSPLLRHAGSSEKLFPVQAQALHDIGTRRGLFASVRVGGGKTLISLLAPYILQSERPLLIVPASILKKTRKDITRYAQHWRVPYQKIRIVTYEALGRDAQKQYLLNYRPDAIICDEAHRLKNPKAAVTRRVTRWMGDNPETCFVAMSGTITKRSLKDYSHILRWVFRGMPPCPRGYAEMEEWSAALDEKTNPMALTLHPGAILDRLASPEDKGDDDVATARRAWRRRLAETPGVVATVEGFEGASLYIDHVFHEQKGANEPSINGFLRTAREGRTPDNWIIPDGMALWSIVRQLSLGFFYMWDPRPPEDWIILRQTWSKIVREWIKHPPKNYPLDSEFQVADAVRRKILPDEEGVFEKWQEVKPKYIPEQHKKAVWIDDHALRQAATWLEGHPEGICWTAHTAFGEMLSKVSGRPFHHNKGLDANRVEIEDAKGPIIAAVKSNSTGRNLQNWNQNLIVSPEPDALGLEQLLGRTHREGQTSDEVSATLMISCVEHVEAIWRAKADAQYTEDTTGQAQKLLYADLDIPTLDDIKGKSSERYTK